MDEYNDYDWDVTDDPGFEDRAREWADENAEELISAFAESDLLHTTLNAHRTIWPLVQRSLKRADERTASADFDEAAFHLSRALEGYVRAVYLDPVFAIMTQAFRDRIKVSKLLAHDIIPNQLRQAGAKRLLLFAMVGITEDAPKAEDLKAKIVAAMESKAWGTRNRVDHSLHMPDAAEIAALLSEVKTALLSASTPIFERIKAFEEQEVKRRKTRPGFFDEVDGETPPF